MVKCAICNNDFKVISSSHLRNKHKLTILEYKKIYPQSIICDPEFIEKMKNVWKTEDYRNKQYKTLPSRIHKIHQDKIGKTLEQIVHDPISARAKMSKSHIGIKQSKDTIRKRVEKISGENHYLWGKQQPDTQRSKHSKAMKAKFISGELDGINMMKRAKGDNFYENKFAQEHPTFLRQYCVVLPTQMIKRECKSRGGLRVFFVDFYDIVTNTIYEIMMVPKCRDAYKENKNMRREKILKELGYNFNWINVGESVDS
jgi:hypothetical protein